MTRYLSRGERRRRENESKKISLPANFFLPRGDANFVNVSVPPFFNGTPQTIGEIYRCVFMVRASFAR